jgi:hypothetical protein
MSDTRGVSEPILEGPGPPDSVPEPPEHRVSGLIPFVHVEDVQRSIDYYHHLGFTLASVYNTAASLSGRSWTARERN